MVVGKEKIAISKEEIKKIKCLEGPGLKLIGFKPRSCLLPIHNYRQSYFLYPSDERVSNSSQLTHSMIKNMVEMDKIAIVKFIPQSVSEMRFCALIP
jgi:ATP-dependent DNA helicase 2 subunit 1